MLTRATSAHQQPRLDLLPCMHPNAAGFDIGSTAMIVALPPDRVPQSVRAFAQRAPAFTPDLPAVVDWFVEHAIDTVALESTGVDWVPIYDVVEQRGITP
jgi:transposase